MKKIDVLIPAHNEALFIEDTLISLEQAFQRASKKFAFTYRLLVGCNGCTDQTAELARPLAHEVYNWPALGKWETLQQLSLQSDADYFVMVDAGASWHPELFNENIWQNLIKENSLGVAVSYNPHNLGFIEKTYWKLEALLKKIEMQLGGLVAVSGVSVFYRADAVKQAFQFLTTSFPQVRWLNDDVVLPLTMRFLQPNHTISIVMSADANENSVRDLGLDKTSSEWTRRQRMMRGNIQWIQNIIPLFFDPAYNSWPRQKVFFILLRRLLKVFWAYFLIAIATVTAIYAFDMMIFLIILGCIALAALYRPLTFKKLVYAFTASALAPIDLIFWKNSNTNKWN